MKSRVSSIVIGVFFFFLMPCAAAQIAPTPDQLIDHLTNIDCNAPGLFEHMPFGDFWAVIPDAYPEMHLEGRKPDCLPETMRALVRLGPKALPALVRHIADARATGLKIGSKEAPNVLSPGGQFFAEEYESRAHAYQELGNPSSFIDRCERGMCESGRSFFEPYTIKVGDICFILIGQIVNRYMVAARYQMTGWTIVNSPVETPALATKVRADWAGVNAEDLKTALLADLHTPLRTAPLGFKRPFDLGRTYEEQEAFALRDLYAGALRRLRFYYPDAYTSLSGDDLAKRQAFEQQEANPYPGHVPPTAETFIDELTTLNCPIPGVSDTSTTASFLVEEGSMEHWSTMLFKTAQIQGHGEVRYPEPCRNAAIRNLVHEGGNALPALLRHLDDNRPTKLFIGQNPVMAGAQYLAEEYDARQHSWPMISCGGDRFCALSRPVTGPYTVKVGDVCFVLIGQIVNRQLNAVRYQPTAIVMVNSPVEGPALAKRVRDDWFGLNNEGLKASLLADIHAGMLMLAGAPDAEIEAGALRTVQWGALRRLRYYFPDAYAALTGTDQKKREAFEKAEREHGQE
ncbi:MAG: hypothetical protein P4L57_15500 [Rhizomicrobium sp.]|nr:hypothetical protein [Rhizomicrobium sp.]